MSDHDGAAGGGEDTGAADSGPAVMPRHHDIRSRAAQGAAERLLVPKPLRPPVIRPLGPQPSAGEAGRLVVGAGVAFRGEIAACDALVVHGRIEASMATGHLHVAEGGRYAGEATAEVAIIEGRFEGTLRVGRHLTVKSGGQVSGTLRYREIEVECGGLIRGDVAELAEEAADGGAEEEGRPLRRLRFS